MSVNYLLFESAVGFAVFDVVHNADSVGLQLPEVKQSISDLPRFGKMVNLVSFVPWQSAASGLEAINMVSEGLVPDTLKSMLELALPQGGKRSKVVLGVMDPKLAGEIANSLPGVTCDSAQTNEVVHALLRGIRFHAPKLLKGLQEGDMDRAHLGLGHAYSRAKVKFSTTRNDNHIMQGIATLDALDKGINSGSMRVREWYGWHFPELIKIVSDNGTYCKCVLAIGDKSTLNEDSVDELAQILGDDREKAEGIVNATKISMGSGIAKIDLDMLKDYCESVSQMADYRKILSESLDNKMGVVAPNLQTILGTPVAARLISHAGSLTNLSKYPASTIQILGAEKALFRALKTKGATPKYGLLYQSSYIGRASQKTKGRISRYLANKCAVASRIDNFSEQPTRHFGEVMKQQLEERLEWYQTGARPMSNADAMKMAMDKLMADDATMDIDEELIGNPRPTEEGKDSKKEKKDKKKRKSVGAEDIEIADAGEEPKKKKSKKENRKSMDVEASGDSERKKKKKDKKSH